MKFPKSTKTTLIYLSLYLSTFYLSPAYAAPIPLGKIEPLPGGYNPGKAPMVTLAKILSNIIGTLTLFGGIFFIIFFLIGGLRWVTASGKQDKVEQAKSQMTNAAIGLIIVVAAYSIAFIVGQVLGIDILNPGKYIDDISP